MAGIRLFLLCWLVVSATASENQEFAAPTPSGPVHFAENFQDASAFAQRWVKSAAMKDGADADIAKYNGEWSVEAVTDNAMSGDVSLVLKDKAKHAAISAPLDQPFEFTDKPFIFQYELKQQEGMDCGGSYFKLLTKTDELDLNQFTDQTPYSIMFGPDSCGTENKMHFIFRHKNPKTGEFEEKHADMSGVSVNVKDKKSHLLRLELSPDNSFNIYVDRAVVKSGNLLTDMSPAVNPPAEIEDPEDRRPEDWDDNEKIADESAVKPEDWDEDAPSHVPNDAADMPSDWLVDEPEHVPDPEAEKPDDWDVDEDGEYEAPLIANPKCEQVSGCGVWTRPTKVNPLYKGKWHAPMIDNPNYQGIWKASKIANPNFFEDKEPFKMSAIGAIGLELWTMSANQAFDNIILTDSVSVADAYAAAGFDPKVTAEAPPSRFESITTTFMEATKERPWLWAVYVLVVIVLPVVLIVACCLPKKKEDSEAARRALAKKTDAPQPDDAPSSRSSSSSSSSPELQEEGDGEGETDGSPELSEEAEQPLPTPAKPKASPSPAKPKASPALAKEKKSPRPVVEEAAPKATGLEPEPEISSSSAAAAAEAEDLSVPEGTEEEPRRSPRKAKKKVRREN